MAQPRRSHPNVKKPKLGSSPAQWDSSQASVSAKSSRTNGKLVFSADFLRNIQIQKPIKIDLFRDVPARQAEAAMSRLRNHRNTQVRDYVMATRPDDTSPEWLRKRELPSSLEIKGEDENATIEAEIEIDVNRVHAAWDSKEQYLETHYRLLREEAVTPLRNAVAEVREDPYMTEKDTCEDAAIYEKVYIVGFTFANAGIAARISFSTKRVGKKIIWEQSKRLLSGTIVALTPQKDGFKKVCLVAVVASRPLAGLEQNPPEIDIFFATSDEIEIDPQQEWLMVEARNGFYEACRHPLLSLQKMAGESFPIADQIVYLSKDVQPPSYLTDRPSRDLSHVFKAGSTEFRNVDILENWPEGANCELDESQIEALQRILTKQLAIIQGPPGTGKTHVSVVALKTLHKNLGPEDPPMIVAAHTNHALDQLLRHIMTFEDKFIRLGGFTTDQENIKPRTLHEVKQLVRKPEIVGGAKGPANAKMRRLVPEMLDILNPLVNGKLIPSATFAQYGVITEAQRDSLIEGTKDWLRQDKPDKEPDDMELWLGKDIRKANNASGPQLFDFPVEEVDLEYEQLKELEAETKAEEDDDIHLWGHRIRLDEPLTGNTNPFSSFNSDNKIKGQLEEQDLWKIKNSYRGAIYCYMQQQVKRAMRDAFRQKAVEYTALVKELKIGRWEVEANFLEQAKIIGCTTTGLSKYRGLIASVNPKVIMIEEAAETLEAYVSAACMPSLEHLVLVGDHEQLRGHCSVNDLQGYPFFLDVSMFERLVRHNIGHTQLIKQRRMIPEIRELLMPIYENLEDHPSVLKRKPVPGMGGVNSYFFIHEWLEDTDALMSKVNIFEADMIVQFFVYLVLNGMEPKEITVLTFYNGQRKLILSRLRRHKDLQGRHFKVVTVDSYQGEENAIVLLSLVRSNHNNSIGFLSVINRVCVALSRAQRGLYIFGNGPLLFHNSLKWFQIARVMGEKSRRMGWYFPITCEVHRNHEYISHPNDFEYTNGGCRLPCREELLCGHICRLNCHPFPHRELVCLEPCVRPRDCGHPCLESCGSPCRCICSNGSTADTIENVPTQHPPTNPRSRSRSRARELRKQYQLPSLTKPSESLLSIGEITQSVQAFQIFSNGGHIEADKKVSLAAEQQAAIATDEEALEKLRAADDAMTAALFGDSFGDSPNASPMENGISPSKHGLRPKSGEPEIIRSSADGKRHEWQATFLYGDVGDEMGKGSEMSLLD